MMRRLAKSLGIQNSSAYRPDHTRAGPSHALQKSPAIYSIFVRILFDPAWQILSPFIEPADRLCRAASISTTETAREIFPFVESFFSHAVIEQAAAFAALCEPNRRLCPFPHPITWLGDG
jgi:hypothetical protein